MSSGNPPRQKFRLSLAQEEIIIIIVALVGIVLIGTVGYHLFASLPWLDAFHNSALIVGGTGIVDPIKSTGGKLFSSIYALISSIIVIVLIIYLINKLLQRTPL